MINGKFFTGLPPKMMERSAGTPNRLESHLFWPDDTHVETAHETRTKRRSSLQTETPRGGSTYQRQSSWSGNGGENEVDTKQRFHKEFAKSSIQFFDNIQEEAYGSRNANRPQARRNLKQDITTKPTAIKMQLPNNDVAQDEYAANQKKQAFTSKIQFYDFVDDAVERRNNKFKPKMDMNDKKEVERHTKNSPKLQVKGIERNLRLVDEQRNNKSERFKPESNAENYDDIERSRSGARVIRNEVRGDTRRNNVGHQHDKRYKSPTRHNSNYRNDYEENNYEFEEPRSMPRTQNAPKKILKHPNNFEKDYKEDYNEYNNGFDGDLELLEYTTRNMRLRDSPKKHVTYGGEVYEYEISHEKHDDDRNMHENDQEYGQRIKPTFKTTPGNYAITTHSSRNKIKTINRETTGKNERRRNSPPQMYEPNDDQQNYEQIENNNHKSVSKTNTKNPINFNNNNDNIKLNNQHQQQEKQQQQQRRSTPKMSLSVRSTPTAASASNDTTTSPTSPTLDAQKHLRSSLCFYGGEIVANNNNRDATPTSDSSSRHRTARSAATSRRICVGLPD